MAVKGTLKSNGNEILIKQSQIEGLDNFNAATAQQATKALQDGEGRNIYNTYATKDELANAELGTGSTPADEIYLRLDGGNQVSNDINFKNTSFGLRLNNSQHAIGFNDVGEPTFINSLGRYFCLGTDDLDGNYIYYYLPEGKDSFNIATKEEIEDGTLTSATAINAQNANKLAGILASNILHTGTEGLTSTVNNAIKAEGIIGVTINIDDENAILLRSKGLYLLTIKENYVSGSETYTYYLTALINIPNYNFKCQTTFIPYLNSNSSEFENVTVYYNGSGNLTLIFDPLDGLSYTFYNCLRLSD